MIDRANLPCSLEEVILNLPQEISTLSVWATIIEMTKLVKMRKVIGLVVHFLPTGLYVCSRTPLVDAALDLTTTCTTRQHLG
jgi:hypothetical protein